MLLQVPRYQPAFQRGAVVLRRGGGWHRHNHGARLHEGGAAVRPRSIFYGQCYERLSVLGFAAPQLFCHTSAAHISTYKGAADLKEFTLLIARVTLGDPCVLLQVPQTRLRIPLLQPSVTLSPAAATLCHPLSRLTPLSTRLLNRSVAASFRNVKTALLCTTAALARASRTTRTRRIYTGGAAVRVSDVGRVACA